MKKLLIGLVIIVAVIIVGVVLLVSNLDTVVKKAVETGGGYVTGVPVQLADATVSLKEGNVTLNGLQVGNPVGFVSDYALAVGTIAVTVDRSSLPGSGPIRLNEIRVEAPQVVYELSEDGSNLATIKQHIETLSGSGGAQQANSGGGRPLIIDHLYVNGGSIVVHADIFGEREMTIPLPDIHLQDIGDESTGAGPAEVADEILNGIIDAVRGALSDIQIKERLQSTGETIQQKSRDAVDAIKGFFSGGSNPN